MWSEKAAERFKRSGEERATLRELAAQKEWRGGWLGKRHSGQLEVATTANVIRTAKIRRCYGAENIAWRPLASSWLL